jgi:hypothetical protein
VGAAMCVWGSSLRSPVFSRPINPDVQLTRMACLALHDYPIEQNTWSVGTHGRLVVHELEESHKYRRTENTWTGSDKSHNGLSSHSRIFSLSMTIPQSVDACGGIRRNLCDDGVLWAPLLSPCLLCLSHSVSHCSAVLIGRCEGKGAEAADWSKKKSQTLRERGKDRRRCGRPLSGLSVSLSLSLAYTYTISHTHMAHTRTHSLSVAFSRSLVGEISFRSALHARSVISALFS